MAVGTSPSGASDVGGADVGGSGGGTQESGGYAGDPALDAGSGGSGGDGSGVGSGGGDGPPQQQELFSFAQRQWPNQQRAEAEFLTTIGRLQARERRVAELEQLVESYKGLGGRAPGEGADQGEAGADVEGGEEPLVDVDSLDWQLISSAMRERGPEVGLYLFAKAMTDALGAGFGKRMESGLAPLNQLREHATVSAQGARLWQQAADAVDEGGQLMFPELADPAAGPLVFEIWNQITKGLPAEVANSPRMARSAILEYRAMQSGASAGNGVGGAGDEGAVNPGQVAAGLVGAMRKQAGAQGVLPAGAPRPTVRPRAKPMTEEEQIRQSLMSEGQERSPLGFRR
jgi:hypothetical protein